MNVLAPEVYRSMGLEDSEYARICELMGRTPNLTELGMFAVMWSEHCGYKYSRPVLSYFKRYREALEGQGLENAGLVDLGYGLAVAMKIESHNHPSAVEPYQGAATGVGGIIRDIFTMGARPIACLNSLRFGPIDEPSAERSRYLFEHVVAGIGGYGNCVGVPTVAGEVAFHRRYEGNPLVNAMCVGIVRSHRVATAAAEGVGNPVLYLGSATGKDGIHGATFASDVLDEESEAKRPNVQIGDPFAEKLLIEATLEALETGAIVAIQDMGAAGLTCSTIEMSAKGGVGMDIDLDRVPTREPGMSAHDMMLSESQERMLCVAQRGRERDVVEVFEKWGLHAVVIGRVTEGPSVRVFREGRLEAEVVAGHLADECPTYTTQPAVPAYHERARRFDPSSLPEVDPAEALLALLASPTIASKRWVYEQYDQSVQTQTTLLPGYGDAAVLAPRGTTKGIALKVDGNARAVYFDPVAGGQLAVAEAARNVACTGAMPTAVTDGLNFGSPRDPEVYWQFEGCVRGIAEACEALGTPVVSGNVSFYNESDNGAILPTPLIGMLGILEHADRRVGMAPPPGAQLGLIWIDLPSVPAGGLGASEYLSRVHGIEDGLPVPPDLSGERALCRVLVELAAEGAILAAHDSSEGGLAVALAEMAMAGGVGLSVTLPLCLGTNRVDALLFGERPGEVVVAFAEAALSRVQSAAEGAGLRFAAIGHSLQGEDALLIGFGDEKPIGVTLAQARATYERAIPSAMA
ncbi:MAG TPA: phosphoribosylformylglycinamidine synthase subunit PurL [Fimbriimonadaceae bacterium]|nr:phosphoribosylformylglycinamidine synthase subunit PurL [Fimbriimonadaceae bacterium]HRJ97917.1 phosphoribosylformylglycinamidine synthase subunit PurL [Fimbriimonadaceae bacterium]